MTSHTGSMPYDDIFKGYRKPKLTSVKRIKYQIIVQTGETE